MGKIKTLDYTMINRIAAGEVIEGPASVVKELVENSIDAGAKNIDIEIKDGGVTYISINDDGAGMDKDDLQMAFLMHSTSKIRDQNDLENIMTLGFRGEALSSISSISCVDITTRTKEDALGYGMSINAGVIEPVLRKSCNTGTRIVVRNLFFNVPARYKFLKKRYVESNHVFNIVSKLTLANPYIAFRYINDGSVMLMSDGQGDIVGPIIQLYGKEVFKNLIYIDDSENNMQLYGYIGKPNINRGNRGYESLFINGRFIKNDIVHRSIEDAYKNKLMKGRFPIFLLNLKLDPGFIDVNVHPAKLEVRFKNDGMIYDFLFKSIDTALNGSILVPSVNLHKDTQDIKYTDKDTEQLKFDSSREYATTKYINEDEQVGLNGDDYEYEIGHDEITIKPRNNYKLKSLEQDEDDLGLLSYMSEPYGNVLNEDCVYDLKPEDHPHIRPISNFFSDFKYIGQILSTYLIFEKNASMYLMDQHAAHEKILYEKILETLNKEHINVQQFIRPIDLKLDEEETNILNDNLEFFKRFGFDIGVKKNGDYVLKGIPYLFDVVDNSGFFTSILDKFKDITMVNGIYDTKLSKIADIACKKAIKKNDKLDDMSVKQLIKDLGQLKEPFNCPHGRPILIEISRLDLDKKFKRIV